MVQFLGAAADRIPTLAGLKFTDEDLMDFERCRRLEDGRFDVLFGRGDGTFEAPSSHVVGTAPSWIASGDFNRDGMPDLATVNAGPGASGTTASVLLNRGDGTFEGAADYGVGGYPGCILVADLNHDNHPDLVTANRTGGTVSVLTGKGDGTFNGATHIVLTEGAGQLVAADFNGDTHADDTGAWGEAEALHGVLRSDD